VTGVSNAGLTGLALLAGLTGVCGCSSGSPTPSVLLPASPASPARTPLTASSSSPEQVMTTQEGRLCLTRGLPRQGLPHLGSPLAVPAHPSSLVLLWVPSRNGRPCVQRRTTASQAQARALALDVNSAPSIAKSAVYNCPTDDGTQVLAYFRASETTTVVSVALSGCSFITAEFTSARTKTEPLRQLLSRLAPPNGLWRSRLG